MTTEEFKDLLEKANLSKKEFSEKANIAYGTVGNWHDENRPVPPWVKSWLNNYIKAKVSDKVIDAVKPFVKV